MANEINAISVNGEEYRINFNGLANRPFGIVTRVPFLEQMSLEFNSESGYYGTSLDVFPVVDDEYIVIWDETEYECVCERFDSEVYLNAQDGSELPFEIRFGKYGSYYMNLETTECPGTHELQIDHLVRSRLPVNCLPHLFIGDEEISLLDALNALSYSLGAGITFTKEAPPAEPETDSNSV